MGHKETTYAHLRKMMLEELERRNYAQTTIDCDIQTIEDFARYFRRPPDQLTPDHIREYQAYLFRERKLAAATVLNSERAIEMSVFVVLAFVRMRLAIAGNRNILTKLAELEHHLKSHDSDIQDLMNALRELMTPSEPNRRSIGFEVPSDPGGKTLKARTVQSRKKP